MSEQKVIQISLPVAAVNQVLTALAKEPFYQVADLIHEVKNQADAQLKEAPTKAVAADKPVAEKVAE